MSGRSVNLTTLFLGRLRPPKRLTSTLCTYFHQKLTTALLKSAEGETKVCGQTGYWTQDLWLTSQVPYWLRYAARHQQNIVNDSWTCAFKINNDFRYHCFLTWNKWNEQWHHNAALQSINKENIFVFFSLLFCIVVLNFVTEYLMAHEILLFTARMRVQSHLLIYPKYCVEWQYNYRHMLHMTSQSEVKHQHILFSWKGNGREVTFVT